MTTLWIIASIVGPWAAGSAVVRALRDERTTNAFVVGAGFITGQVLVGGLLYLSLALSGAGHARWLLIVLALIGFVAVGMTRRTPRALKPEEDHPIGESMRPWTYAVFGLIGLGLLWKLRILLLSHTMIPFRSDDAVTIWLYRAKVITILDHLSFNPSDVYYHGGSNPRYPLLVSLIAAWIPMVVGRWDEHLATLPWLFFGVSLLLVIAGGLREHVGAAAAWMVAYAAFSLPLFVVHMYRPGYADLPLACILATAVVSLLGWRGSGRAKPLALGVFLLVGCAFTKREGPIVASIAAVAMIAPAVRTIAKRPWRFRLAASVVAIASLCAVGWFADFRDIIESVAGLSYQAGIGPALVRHAIEWASFGPLFVLLGVGLLVLPLIRPAPLAASAWMLIVGLAAYVMVVFLSPLQARFAFNDQTPSRLLLQGAPASLVVLAAALGSARRRSRPPASIETSPGGA